MSAPLILVRNESSPVSVPALACVEEFRQRAKSVNTRRAYRSDWEHFAHWCQTRGRTLLPAEPDTVAWYLADSAACLKVATLQRRLAAISKTHQAAGWPSPASRSHAVVRETWQGIRRVQGVAQNQKAPLLPADLRRIAGFVPTSLAGTRDRALLLVGFAGALRRSELVGLDVEDLQFREEGLSVTVRRSKTDQEGQGRQVGVPYGSDPATCPFRAVRAWVRDSGISGGPSLSSGGSLRRSGPTPPVRQVGGAAGEAVREGDRKGCPLLLGAQLPGGIGDGRDPRRSVGTQHHGPDGTPQRRHGPALCPGLFPFPGQCRSQDGPMTRRRWQSPMTVLLLVEPEAGRILVSETASCPRRGLPLHVRTTLGTTARLGSAVSSGRKGLGPPDHLRRRYLQHFTNSEYRAECRALNAALNQADVRAVQPARQSELLFLGKVARTPELAQRFAERLLRASGRVDVLSLPLRQQHNAATLAIIIPRIIIYICRDPARFPDCHPARRWRSR